MADIVFPDISYHQGIIDWATLSKAIKLAVIRVQCGSTILDSKLAANVADAKRYGVPFGHYAYAKFLSVADAEVEARDFIARADKSAKFVVVDVEEITVKDPRDLLPATQRFIDICKAAGYKTGLYAGDYFFKYYGLTAIKADFRWIAKYSSKQTDIPCDIWQFTSTGSLPGIAGNVDLNKLVGSKTLAYFLGTETKWTKNGNNQWFYTVNGVPKTGWMKDNGKWYYLDPSTGAMRTGWLNIGGKWYFFGIHGDMQTGWVQSRSKWYYLDPSSGAMKTGWVKVGTKWYYLEANGAMKTGWFTYKGKWYYLEANGAMKQGWLKYKDKWYYLNPAPDTGNMVTGWLHEGKHWYYLNPKGDMVTGKLIIAGKNYEFLPNGQLKE